MDPTRDLALGETFTFETTIDGTWLTVSVSAGDEELGTLEHDMSESGYENDDTYTRWGAYNSNRKGEEGDYVAVTYQ